jgi:prolyl oligopeptidase
MDYPHTTIVEQVDDYHGKAVSDPYRWLEDVDAPETLAWIEAQNRLTFSFLESIPQRPALQKRLAELWDFPRLAAPFKRGGCYFQFRNTGLQNQDVLFVMDSPETPGRMLLDPNQLSVDGTVALTGWVVSKDGSLLAYATSASGSDWQTWHVRRVDSGEDLPDRIEWSKFSRASWLPDSSGFYYSRYDAPAEGLAYTGANYHHKVYFHRLGTSQDEDRLVYHRPDEQEWGFDAEVSEDGRYLVFSVWQGTDTRNRVFYQDLSNGAEVVELVPELEAGYHFVDNEGSVFYFRTDLGASRGRVIAIDVTNPQRDAWQTVIPESEDVVELARRSGDFFIGLYLHDAYHQLRLFTLAGEPSGEIELPGIGSIPAYGNEPALHCNREDDEVFYAFHSFAVPPTVYRYDLQTRSSRLIAAPEIRFDFSPYITRQGFVASKDGTRVPLFLVHRKDIALDGSNPTLLYGYGGFNISLTPAFQISRLAWLEMGGVLAVACLRGGGEYGEEWHQAGMKGRKQNVFDDFIACAEHLIEHKVTSPARLAIQGGSNGGLLVGAAMTQRPELFAAALPAVGVMDMLRFHKFTIGWAWVSDYGSADNAEEFPYIFAYSPLHNLKPGTCYPATLVTTADHDDRVVPGHSFKFAAALQAAQGCSNPTLIRIQTKAGHGYGKPTAILIAEQADIWAFLVKEVGIES